MKNKRKLILTKEQKKSLDKYLKYIDKEAKNFKLTSTDLSNLYDLFYMMDTPKQIHVDLKSTLKINNMLKWYYEFHKRIEKIVVPELYTKEKKRDDTNTTNTTIKG